MINRSQNQWLHLLAGFGAGVCSATAGATPYNIADKPLFLSVSVPPNVTLTLDDSGSMAWGAAPDGIAAWGYNNETIKNTRRWKSSTFNPIYYDPETDYVRPVNAVNNSLSTSFTAAYFNGFITSRGTVNLSTSYRPMDVYDPSYSTSDSVSDTHRHFVQNPTADYYSDNNYDYRNTGVPAYYYRFDSSKFGASGCPAGGDTDDDDCYTRIIVSATSGPLGSDERQNFANWYSFYRTRNLATVSAASLAFSQLGGETRVAWQNLNSCNGFDSGCQGWSTSTYDSQIRKFDGSHRQNFYNWLFRLPASGGTPLRTSLIRAGDMFKTDRPYHDDPGVNSNFGPVCRQNYSIVMTDGIWNGDNPAVGNVDNSTQALPDGVTYTPRMPFMDSNSNSLADIAFEYWATDLRNDLADSPSLKHEPVTGDETIEYDDPNITGNVNASATLTKYWNPKNDPASWQHMVNFVVGVGLSGWLTEPNLKWEGDTYAGGYNALATGHASWPGTGSDTVPGNVYDLWHAALNSRGQFFSAESPEDVVTAFRSIIQRIHSSLGSASNLALNAGSVSSSSQLFQAVFDSADWSGHLLARPFSDGHGNMSCSDEDRGEVCPPVWDAGCSLTGGVCPATGGDQTAQDWNTGRTILAYDGSTGKPFRWNDLTASQQATLSAGDADPAGAERLNYLRGDRSNEEQNGGSYRNRITLLGDIVHSTPAYVGAPEKEYPVGAWVDKLGGSASESGYGSFLSGYATRQHVVYAGSNGGLLHGFRAGHFDGNGAYQTSDNDGREVLAYVPSQVFPELARLTDPTYRSAGLHKYFVDGELEATDAYFNGSWHTVLVGGLGAGGQGIFALDVTDPAGFSEASAGNTVLWEFTDAYDDGTYTGDDLGFTYGQPHVVRLHNGKWGVLVGNGYNNTANSTLTDPNISATGNAVLYILDVENGTVMAKLDTFEGTAAPHSGGRPNGLATVTPIDLDGDVVTDYVYAGDLYGNVWRFDLTATSAGNWKVSEFGSGGSTPLFVAEDANSPAKRQPMTTRVLADVHPKGLSYGVMVYAGTGKYFEDGDNAADTTTNHTVYGVWDADFAPFSSAGTVSPSYTHDIRRAQLLEQKIEFDFFNPVEGERERILSKGDVNWTTEVGWYVDLQQGNSTYNDGGTPDDPTDDDVTPATSYTLQGEMVQSDAVIVGDTLVVPTTIPSQDPCSTGGSGWVLALSKGSGGRLRYAPFHIITGTKPIQGRYVANSMVGTPTYISRQLVVPLGDNSQGEDGVLRMPFQIRGEGRQSWRELR